ncbi:MAG TPA: phosphatase PAP2 family protein [Acidobacteriaceae bacterium]|nr:phosphatase PAP2 family protein [Acidobacteriaceae bacterium]
MLQLKRAEWAGLVSVVVLAALLLVRAPHDPLAYWTIAGSAIMVYAGLQESDRRDLLWLAVLLPASIFAIDGGNITVTSMSHHTLDAVLSRMDSGRSVWFYHWTLAHGWCQLILVNGYESLPFFVGFVMSTSTKRSRCAIALVIASVVAPLFYLAFPAVGPAHVGSLTAPRNCMPSLHMTWALICLMLIEPRLRIVGVLFAVLTAFATIGTGEHYIVDLAAAVPYTVAVCWIAGRCERWRASVSRSRLQEAAGIWKNGSGRVGV